jgi:hypothetical protein
LTRITDAAKPFNDGDVFAHGLCCGGGICPSNPPTLQIQDQHAVLVPDIRYPVPCGQGAWKIIVRFPLGPPTIWLKRLDRFETTRPQARFAHVRRRVEEPETAAMLYVSGLCSSSNEARQHNRSQ